MDTSTFDQLTRRLAGRLTRRVGLAGALGALAGGKALDAAGRARERTRRHPGGTGARRHDAEVIDEKKPCGPTAAENKCRKNKDCCTNYCKPPKGDAKTGRCRCIKPGKKCKNGQTCCGGALCQNRKCTIQPTCSAGGGPCATDDACCTGLVCISGACGSCTETVCASGCPFTDVNAAYAAATAGDTIYIGPGTYPTGIVVTKDVTLAACPGVTGVKLVPDRKTPVPDWGYGSYYAIIAEDTSDTTTLRTVKLHNLVLEPTAVPSNDEAMLYSGQYETVSFQLANCTVNDARFGIWAGTGSHEAIDCLFDGCGEPVVVEYNNSTRATSLILTRTSIVNSVAVASLTTYGVSFDSSGTTSGSVTITDCTIADNIDEAMEIEGDSYNPDKHVASFTNTTIVRNGRSVSITGFTLGVTGCTIENNGGCGIDATDVLLTVTDTSIKNNTTEYWGGGVYIGAEYSNASLTLAGSTMITGNSSTGNRGGGGIMRYELSPKTVTVTGTTTSNITGNTPNNCALWPDPPDTEYTVNCGTWT